MRGGRPWWNPIVSVSTDRLLPKWLVINIWFWRYNTICSYALTKRFNNIRVPWLHNCYELIFIVIIIVVSLCMLPHVYQIIVFLILLAMFYSVFIFVLYIFLREYTVMFVVLKKPLGISGVFHAAISHSSFSTQFNG